MYTMIHKFEGKNFFVKKHVFLKDTLLRMF